MMTFSFFTGLLQARALATPTNLRPFGDSPAGERRHSSTAPTDSCPSCDRLQLVVFFVRSGILTLIHKIMIVLIFSFICQDGPNKMAIGHHINVQSAAQSD